MKKTSLEKKDYLKIRLNLNLEKKYLPLVKHITLDACLVLTCILLWANFKGSPLKFIMIPLVTALIFRNFSLMHEASHGLISKNRNINQWVGTWAGAICLLPFEAWKQVHLEHHYWSGNIEKDPVMGLVRNFNKMPVFTKKLLNYSWKFWIPTMAFLQNVVFWYASIKSTTKKAKSPKIAASFALPLLLWGACLFLLPNFFVGSILIPAVVLYLIAIEVVNFPHHLELPQHDGDTKLSVWQQHETTRSCVYPQWFAKYFVLNFNYHIEHHLFPDAPWYTLTEIHTVLRAELKESYNTDPQFAWILNNRPRSLEGIFCVQAKEKKEVRAHEPQLSA